MLLTKVACNRTLFTPKTKFLPKYQRTPTSLGSSQKSLFHSISIYAAKKFTQVNPRANPYRINKYRYNTTPISVSDFEVNEFDQDENTVVGAKLIPIVNKLQEVFSLVGMHLDLPQIVVVGAQSSGKSSVLENLVGKDFLPRGSGIVTRRPLILQMHKTDPGTVEYGEFFHKPNEKFLDFHKIRDEIERETERLTGKNKGVSADPIILRVYSPNILPLTLVDTPGIARVPVGDQPHDIEKQIRDMVHSYILPRNAIILAVQAANQDLATSDALKISREVDPEGNRTIGVLTKLDLMDAGTNALDALSGRVIPLKLGFVGVVNRSQLDINMGKAITTSLKNEREYFEKNNHYNLIANRCGTRYLALKCNKLLTRHIREVLPEIKRDIKKKLRTLKDELMELGEPPVGSINDKKWMLLQMLNKFCVDFRDAIEGNKTLLTTQELHGGARIRYIFDDIFRKQLNSIDPTAGLTLDEYRMAIRNAAGAKQSLFVPEGAFEMLVKRQIEKLKDPALQCAELVLNELQRICAKLDYKDLGRFTYLRESVNDVANNVLRKNLAPTQRMIKDLIECELAYINTNHPDFVGGTQMSMLNQLPEGNATQNVKKEPYKEEQRGLFNLFFGGKKKENLNQEQQSNIVNAVKLELPSNLTINSELTEREKIQVGLIKKLLESYFNIARKNIQDAVTKAIWHFLVNKAEQTLHRALITELYQDGDHERLLKESDVVKERRRILQNEIDALKKAKQILEVSEVPELLE